MFEDFKDTIKDLAYKTVCHVENALSTLSGKEKKKAAIEILVTSLKIPIVVKPLAIFVLNNFIDKSIEKAVECMNQIKNEG